LSVVVATYNRPEELTSCLVGLSHQTIGRDRFEVIVVDDCSQTPVDEIVARFSGLLRVRLVRKTSNEGLGEARRSGVEAATGDVTLFFDDDDVPRADCLAAHLAAHAEHARETDAVLGFTALHADVQLNAAMEFGLVSGQRLMSYAALSEGAVPWHCAWGGRTSYKTALLRRVPPRGRWLEDTDLNARLRHVGLRVWYTRNAVQYMTHELSISQLRSRARTLGMAAADVLARLAEPDLPVLLGVAHATERAGEQAPQLPMIEEVIDQLSAQPMDALSCLPVTLNGQRSTADQVLWAALNAVMDYENRLGFLVRSRQLKGFGVTGFGALPRWGDSEELARIVSVFATAFDVGDPAELFLLAPTLATGPTDALEQVRRVLASCGRASEDVADVHVVPIADEGALHGSGDGISELIWLGHPARLGCAPPLALRPDVGANDLRRLAGLAPRGGPAGLR
jgi:glycosyltransferase involved in cell wall biosynthesis